MHLFQAYSPLIALSEFATTLLVYQAAVSHSGSKVYHSLLLLAEKLSNQAHLSLDCSLNRFRQEHYSLFPSTQVKLKSS